MPRSKFFKLNTNATKINSKNIFSKNEILHMGYDIIIN